MNKMDDTLGLISGIGFQIQKNKINLESEEIRKVIDINVSIYFTKEEIYFLVSEYEHPVQEVYFTAEEIDEK